MELVIFKRTVLTQIIMLESVYVCACMFVCLIFGCFFICFSFVCETIISFSLTCICADS